MRRWIGTKTWRWLHRWTLAVYVLALAHVVGAGTDGRSPWMLAMLAVLVAPNVFALAFLAAVVRFATLGEQSLWLDEALTVHLLRHPFPTTIRDVLTQQAQPPPYFFLAWPWVKVFGDGEFGLRSLSALFGTLTVPVAWAAAKIVAGRRAAHVTALLIALAPAMIWYSQEARAYSLFVFLGALSLLFFLRSTVAPTRLNLWLWAGASLLAVSAHYFALFAVLPEAVWLAWRVVDRRRDWPPFAALAGGLLLLAPVVLFQRKHGGAEWIGHVDFTVRLRNTGVLAVGGPVLPGGLEGRRTLAAVAVAVLLATASAIALLRTRGAARGRTLATLAVGVTAIALPGAGGRRRQRLLPRPQPPGRVAPAGRGRGGLHLRAARAGGGGRRGGRGRLLRVRRDRDGHATRPAAR